MAVGLDKVRSRKAKAIVQPPANEPKAFEPAPLKMDFPETSAPQKPVTELAAQPAKTSESLTTLDFAKSSAGAPSLLPQTNIASLIYALSEFEFSELRPKELIAAAQNLRVSDLLDFAKRFKK